MTTPLELSRKVATYLACVCPPPGVMRWEDYLTGDDDADRPVLFAAATALRMTVTQLFDAAVAADVARKAKRVAARVRREQVEVVT